MRMQQFREAQQRLAHELQNQIPDDVARMAHEQHLGSPQTRHAITRLGRGWRLSRFTFPFFLLALLFMFLTLVITISTLSDHLHIILITTIIIMGIFYVAFMAWAIVTSISYKNCTLYTCDGGFILKQSVTRLRVVRWEEIETIWETAARHPLFYLLKGRLYTLRCHDGFTLTIGEFNRYAKMLDKTFEQKFTRRRLPFHFADYQAGQMLNFGPLSVNREGISNQGQMLPWEQVADISLVKGKYLVIYKAGERPETWLKLPAFNIPNLGILLALFKRIRGQNEQEMNMEVSAEYGTGATIVATRNRVDPLPEGLAALAEEHQLGERRLDQDLGRSRRTGQAEIIALLVVETIMAAATTACTVIAVSIFRSSDYHSSLTVFVEFALLGLLLLRYTTVGIVHSFQQIHNYTYIFEHGFILTRGQQLPVAYRWEDIEAIWRLPISLWINRNQQASTPLHAYAHTIQLRDGAKYTLTRLNIDQQALGKIIQEQIVPLQLPATVAAYQEQQTLAFGPVQVNQQGITMSAQTLPWDRVKSVSLQSNYLVVYDIARRKPWGKVPAKQVPNLFLLFALADYARGKTGLGVEH